MHGFLSHVARTTLSGAKVGKIDAHICASGCKKKAT